ncbi:MAG: hypothetical protein IK063_04910 [Clostridia bacterium]|nr:hypothetical protein [Clostridia bacterium]
MKNTKNDKLICWNRKNENGTVTEKYHCGNSVIGVSRFRNLVTDENCVVISFEKGRLNRSQKTEIARRLGADLNTCCVDDYTIYGRAV